MPRPKKSRTVCQLPRYSSYGPIPGQMGHEVIVMTVEEFETIRLIDLEKMDQQQVADKMGVARSTVQRMYNEARSKVADSLINGKLLQIEGGNYRLCQYSDDECPACGRRRRRRGRE